MNERIKKLVIFAVFLVVLILASLTAFFSKSLLWPNSNVNREFDGIIFNDSDGVENLQIARSVSNDRGEKLIKYDIKFNYTGEDSTARIMGTPARQIFFGEGATYKKSKVKLKGDFDKINKSLFEEKLKLKVKDFYNKTENKEFSAVSEVKMDISEKVGEYEFQIYYDPNPLYFSGDQKVEDASVFVTNAKVENWTESTKTTDSVKEAYTNSGYYINKLELINQKLINKISLLNTMSTVVFLILTLGVIALIWFDKGSFPIYLGALFIMIPTFYRFIDKGTSNLGILIMYPILGCIASIAARFMSSEEEKTFGKNEMKQSIAFLLIYFVISVVLFMIPRVFVG
ncbi:MULTISPECIES: hypothetical protein [Peptoniphilus]|uniref:hypothetical protein n=1 Tax=Peptoniphilus TaxID=162289 RepID=UPI0029050F3D|nr:MULTISPECIES: hypothetical protein [Peptoniphilus]MDU1043758.1 hypothetical protein [Peptoniphilus rhinitidis]MDU2116048.1 hypothetical protein [Peptoniphilus lacydonensis]MDU3750714.1 hypothetical protein [Peptoniphilus rhinitidis]